jgi:hypothetical protein
VDRRRRYEAYSSSAHSCVREAQFWIDFYSTGIRAVVMLPAGQSFNNDFFVGTGPPSIVDDRAPSRPKLKASGTFLRRGSARPHLTSENHGKFGINGLPHSPYSQDLAPCDSWPFGYRTHCLEGRFSDDDIALDGGVSDIPMSIGLDMFVRVFAE